MPCSECRIRPGIGVINVFVTESNVMRMIEETAVNMGTGMDKLMEHAGSKTAAHAAKLISNRKIKDVCILCGSGNNGGDGFVIARLLSVMCNVAVILTSGQPQTVLAKENFGLMPSSVQVLDFASHYYECVGIVRDAGMIIDAVYGIGFHGALSPEIADLISFCNENKHAVKIAVDVPSGIEADTGRINNGCFEADLTVTFTALKPLHILYPSCDLCGRIAVENVGIPKRIVRSSPFIMMSTDEYLKTHTLPEKKSSAHKGDNGTLLSVCGSYGMAGAAVMSSEAALRSGIGLLKAAVPKSIYPIMASKLSEPVFIPLDESDDGIIDIDEYGRLIGLINEGCDAVLIGCGLGQNNNIKSLIPLLVDGAKKPLVIDADGINALTTNINVLKRSEAPKILTPHPGEMARLLGTDIKTVQSDRYNIAKRFSAAYGVTLILKGANTLIACPSGRVYVNLTGNNGMGKGGSGDMLAGMAAAFLANGADCETAAVASVYYHGLAGDRCAEKYSRRSMLPSDMIAELKNIY